MPHFVIVGLGSIGRRHAANLASLHPDARFTFVRRGARVDETTERFRARVVDDVEQVSDDVDLAVLATPSADHIESLPALIERNWPLLVEKPIVSRMADVAQVLRVLDGARPATRAAGFNLRHLPSLARMKRHVDDGDVGRVVRASFVAGQWLPDWRPGIDYRSSYSASAERGGGVELDLCHEFDAARWFFGDVEVAFVASGRASGLEISAHDVVTAILTPSGAPYPLISVTLDYVSRRRVRTYEVVGELGTLRWDLDGELSLTTTTGRRPLGADPGDFDVGASYVSMVNSVLAAASRKEGAAVQSLTDGLASTRLAIDIRDRGGSR